MMGFVYKDFFLLRRQISYIAILFLLYTVLSAAGVFGSYILPAIVVIMGMVFPMSSFSYDEQARWDKFAAATPVGRKGVVAGRYLFALLLILISSAIVAALQLLLSLSGLVEQPISELLLPVLACAVAALLMDAIFLPLLFRFGAEKARILGMILFVVIFAGCAGAGFLAGGAQQSPSLSVHALLLAIAVAAAAAVAALWTSYYLSQRIYAKKEL